MSGKLENEISGSLVWTYGNTDSECTLNTLRLSLNIAIKYYSARQSTHWPTELTTRKTENLNIFINLYQYFQCQQ